MTDTKWIDTINIMIAAIESVESLVEIAHVTQGNPEIHSDAQDAIAYALLKTVNNCDHEVGICYCEVIEAIEAGY